MESMLFDELLQEIFLKLPPSSSSSICLVSRRWLHLYRASRTSLSLRLNSQDSTLASLPSLLSHYHSLSSLSLLSSDLNLTSTSSASSFSDHLLLTISSYCSNLRQLRFLTGPVSLFPLLSLSKACTHLTSLTISLSRPLFLRWVLHFPCLRELSICVCSGDGNEEKIDYSILHESDKGEELESELGLETLCLSGIRAGDRGFGWLYRSCKKLRKLQLKSCEGIGDGGLFSSFVQCLQGIEHVELRTCRSIVDGVLLQLSGNCHSLNSLLVYDGGSRDGLLHFITNSGSHLRKLDLRLPLDLKNDHLFAVAANFRGLSCLRLQSCCLVTGEGLKTLGVALSSGLEELALINCDVVEREPGLLATLGQNLRCLRKLDLSHNETLLDKEIISMLVSCNRLVELKLRGCKGITIATMVTASKSCKDLEDLDVLQCCGIHADAVELFVLDSRKLKRLQVEENKVSDGTQKLACNKFIEVVVS